MSQKLLFFAGSVNKAQKKKCVSISETSEMTTQLLKLTDDPVVAEWVPVPLTA